MGNAVELIRKVELTVAEFLVEGRTDSGRIPGHYVKYTKRCMESYFRVRGLLVAQGCQKGDCEDKSLQASLMCSTDGRGIYKNHTRSSFLIKF